MKNIKKRLIGWTLGLALSLGVGIGIASNTHSEITGVEAASTTYTHPLTAKPAIDVDNELSTVTWHVTGKNVNAYNSSMYAGVQFGTKKVAGSITFKSKFAWGEEAAAKTFFGKTKVEKVKVWLNAGTDVPTASVTIGNIAATSDGTVVAKNTVAKSYKDTTCVTFTPANGADSGIIEISASTNSKAAYFSAIEVIATEGVQKNLTSIEITTPPTKIEYYAGEKFDPTGLVVTKTFDDNTTEDLPYNNSNKDDFTFNPASELKTTDTAVAITVGDKTVNQSITVKPARTITSVALNGDMKNKTYYEGDTWDVSGLSLTVTWNEGEPTTVQLSDLVSGTDYTITPETASLGIASVDIAGHYADKSFGGTISGLTVTERPSSMQIAYEAAKNLGLSGTTSVAYEFSGIVVGTIGNSFFVQDEDYGMYVYNKPVSGLAVGKRIDIKSTLTTYSGMIETKEVSSATLGEEATMPAAATISSVADLKALKQNVLVDLKAVMPATMQNWSSSASPLNTLTIGADEIVMKFDKFAYNKSSVSEIYSSLAGKEVSIKNAVSSAHGTLEANQLLLTEQTTIEVIEDDGAKALAFGTSFLNKTATACTDGTKDNSEALKTIWTTLNTEFNALSDSAKKLVKGAVANNAGTDLEKAMARYDHIVKRYSAVHTEIDDFIGRGVTTSLTNQLFKANTTNNIMVISLIACASVATIGGFFFIRKRKEQN